MKTTRFFRPATKLMMGISVMTLLLSGCSKAEDSVLPADESSSTKDVILNYSYTDTTPTAGCCIDSLPFETLSEDEIAALNLMREEEFLAHDVYVALAQLYTKPIFLNISRSELRHTDAVKALMVKYSLPDPGANHVTGVFTNPDLQTLYNSLVSQGSKSLLDGLIVGCTIEDLDILDLKNHLLEVDNQDLTLVFNNLMRGSRNHLRSFYANVLFSGGTYTPQFITQGDFDAIVNSEHETGPGC
jgi:hypothetical protein